MNKVLTKNLHAALKQVKRTSIHALPVLNYIRLQFTEGELRLTTTDLDKTLTAKCPARMNEEWTTCVPMVHKCEVVTGYTHGGGTITAKHKLYPFHDYVKVMETCADVLELTFDPTIQILTIKAGNSRTEFKCLDAQEFPAL